MPKEEITTLLKDIEVDEKKEELDLLADEDEEIAIPVDEKKKRPRGLKSKLDIFEHNFKKHPKGHYKVWKAKLEVTENFKVNMYLHCVNDSKVCFRLSTRYAATPSKGLVMTSKDPVTNKKQKLETLTSAAHKSFRMRMGHNDQSDGKRQVLGLSSSYCRYWPQKPFRKAWEDGIINIYANYLLDPSCPIED